MTYHFSELHYGTNYTKEPDHLLSLSIYYDEYYRIDTVSLRLKPRGSIFQYWFLGEVQLKNSLKKWTF